MKKKFIRIIPKLDIKNGLLIKGINLEGLRVLGDPYDFAKFYYECGADEICYVDNVATLYGTNDLNKFISRTAKDLFIPMTVGGGIRSIEDIKKILSFGADKVCLNSQIIKKPSLINKAKKIFGSSTICAIIETIKIDSNYFISCSNGRDLVKTNPVTWARHLEDLGVGEIFLTSVNKEGLKSGFDIDIIEKISSKLNIPVIAHGGAGNFEHIKKLIKNTNIDGVAISSLLHYSAAPYFIKKFKNIGNTHFLKTLKKETKKTNVIKNLKIFLKKNKINVRI
jgi:imidazole glycerol-phosphate synthase subunit HisF